MYIIRLGSPKRNIVLVTIKQPNQLLSLRMVRNVQPPLWYSEIFPSNHMFWCQVCAGFCWQQRVRLSEWFIARRRRSSAFIPSLTDNNFNRLLSGLNWNRQNIWNHESNHSQNVWHNSVLKTDESGTKKQVKIERFYSCNTSITPCSGCVMKHPGSGVR